MTLAVMEPVLFHYAGTVILAIPAPVAFTRMIDQVGASVWFLACDMSPGCCDEMAMIGKLPGVPKLRPRVMLRVNP